MPGVRDQHAGCVSDYLVEHDLFDFLLLSLPDNDWHSHKHGPDAQVWSIAQADPQLARVVDAAGGLDDFLAEHAVIAMADHSQSPIIGRDLAPGRAGGARRPAAGARGESARAARSRRSPSALAARRDGLRAGRRPSATRCAPWRRGSALALEGVDLVMWLERDAHDAPREGVIASRAHGELRFAPGGRGRRPARGRPGTWRARSR